MKSASIPRGESSRERGATAPRRSGLRIRGARGHPEVRAALLRFARWLRRDGEFPIRVPVYLTPGRRVVTRLGDEGCALFFSPRDRTVEPYIRVATGHYPTLKKDLGRDDALAAFLVSLAHEVIHYRQWISRRRVTERGVDRRAVAMMRRYGKTRPRP